MDPIRFDVYGRFRIAVERTDLGWRVTRLGLDGKRSYEDLLIGVAEEELADALEVLYHELGRPGAVIRRIEPA